jgi:type I restriction enzyme S subunit
MTFVATDLGMFPRTWLLNPVGELFDTQLGKMLSQKAHGGGDPKPYLRNKNVQWGNIETSDVLVMDFNEREKEKFKLVPGDLLVCEGGVVGRAAIWNGAISECYYQKALHRLRPSNGSVTNEFMLFWMRFAFEIQNFYGVSGASSTIAHLPAAQLRALEVPLPPLPEQKKIAHILSTVQRAIEAQDRIIQTTTELKKALMHKLFTEGFRREPQKQTEIGLVPESWEVVPLSECAVVQTGIAKGRKVNAEEAVVVPYLRVANVQDGYLDLSEMKTITIRKNEQQRFALQDGDVVLTEGGDFDKLGRGFIWHGQIENCVHQNHVFAVRPDKVQISSEFFAYLSQSPYGKRYFLSVAHKTTNLACINTTKLKAFPVLLPPQDQQTDIVVACSSIDGKIRNATNKKNQLQDLFHALLHELMTAKIRVNSLLLPC